MAKKRGYPSDSTLMEDIVNYLYDTAGSNSLGTKDMDDFSFKTIVKMLQDRYDAHDVPEARISKVLDRLEMNDVITIKSRSFSVYIPKKYESKFSSFVKRFNPIQYAILYPLTGYLVLSLAFALFGTRILVGTDNVLTFLLIWGFFAPFLAGLVIHRAILPFLEKNVRWFSGIIDFFGGQLVFIYALIITIVAIAVYTILSQVLTRDMTPSEIVGIIGVFFMGTLIVGRKAGIPKQQVKDVIA